MDVILLENYPSLGYVGETIKVRNGYARNFLIPRGIALAANERNKHLLKHRLQGVLAKRARLKSEAELIAEQLKSVELNFTMKIGDKGRSFGSVTGRDIEAALREKGFAFERTQIRLGEVIKKVGEFSVSIRLHSQVTASLPIKVVAEKPKDETKDETIRQAAKEKKERKPRRKAAALEDGEESKEEKESEDKPVKRKKKVDKDN